MKNYRDDLQSSFRALVDECDALVQAMDVTDEVRDVWSRRYTEDKNVPFVMSSKPTELEELWNKVGSDPDAVRTMLIFALTYGYTADELRDFYEQHHANFFTGG